MSFASCITHVERGIYRHNETGFFLHEVYNLEQVIAANGAFAFYDDDDTYAVLTGRTLGSVIRACSVYDMTSLATAMSVFANNMVQSGAIYSTAPVNSNTNTMCSGRPIVVVADLPFVIPGRLFALINNTVDGWKPRKTGGAGPGSPSTAYNPILVLGNTATVDGVQPATGLQGSFVSHSTPIQYYANYDLKNSSAPNQYTDPIPHLIAKLGSNTTPEQYWRQVELKTEHREKSEVKDYLAACKVRFMRLLAVTPHSTDLYFSMTGKDGQAQYIGADRKPPASSGSPILDSTYQWCWWGNVWMRVPALISGLKGHPAWQPATTTDTSCATKYTFAPFGGIGGRSLGSLMGSVGLSTNNAGSISLGSLAMANTLGMENFGIEPGMPSQILNETPETYQARCLAGKPSWTGIGGFRFVPNPSVEHLGGMGATALCAYLALSEDSFVGEYIQAFGHHRMPNKSVMVRWKLPADLTAAGGLNQWVDSAVGGNLFAGNTLESLSSLIFSE